MILFNIESPEPMTVRDGVFPNKRRLFSNGSLMILENLSVRKHKQFRLPYFNLYDGFNVRRNVFVMKVLINSGKPTRYEKKNEGK
jgi:hypothetical protein